MTHFSVIVLKCEIKITCMSLQPDVVGFGFFVIRTRVANYFMNVHAVYGISFADYTHYFMKRAVTVVGA